MASSRDVSSSRPSSMTGPSHRNSSTSRQHSHSISLGALNSSHRVSRRKSVNSSAGANAQALAAALREHGEAGAIASSHRRSLNSKKGLESTSMGNPSSLSTYFSKPVVGTSKVHVTDRKGSEQPIEEDAVEDGVALDKSSKNRSRRASEGSYLAKSEGKRLLSELRCDTCGKGYKHSSCLTKHMWEHDPAWAYTSKLLISKHQQVQLLEAASVLVTMTDGPEAENGPNPESDGSSGSPGFSGSSEPHDELSSTETTPPPMSDAAVPVPSKRYSSGSTGFSRSYRSVPSSSFAESIASPALNPRRFSGADQRPLSSGTDDGGLAAAAELLNFGTPRTMPVQEADIPPVPPLPEQYQNANRLSGFGTPSVFHPIHTLTQAVSDEREVKMQDTETKPGPVHAYSHVRASENAHMDDGEFGLFRMEE